MKRHILLFLLYTLYPSTTFATHTISDEKLYFLVYAYNYLGEQYIGLVDAPEKEELNNSEKISNNITEWEKKTTLNHGKYFYYVMEEDKWNMPNVYAPERKPLYMKGKDIKSKFKKADHWLYFSKWSDSFLKFERNLFDDDGKQIMTNSNQFWKMLEQALYPQRQRQRFIALAGVGLIALLSLSSYIIYKKTTKKNKPSKKTTRTKSKPTKIATFSTHRTHPRT